MDHTADARFCGDSSVNGVIDHDILAVALTDDEAVVDPVAVATIPCIAPISADSVVIHDAVPDPYITPATDDDTKVTHPAVPDADATSFSVASAVVSHSDNASIFTHITIVTFTVDLHSSADTHAMYHAFLGSIHPE